MSHQVRERSGRDNQAAPDTRARAEVENKVGAPHGFLVMLDHDEGIAARFQYGQCGKQHFVVARVQADGRLVQHIKHPAQVRAELRREADALGLAARQRGHGSAQLDVPQADFLEEMQALANLRQDIAGDAGRLAFEFEFAEKLIGIGYGDAGKILNGRPEFQEQLPCSVRICFPLSLTLPLGERTARILCANCAPEPPPSPSQEGSSTTWPVPLLGGVRGGFFADRLVEQLPQRFTEPKPHGRLRRHTASPLLRGERPVEGEHAQSHRARDGVQPRAVAFRAQLALAFLPPPPAFFDRVGARATVNVFREVEQFSETPALGTPALGRIIAEILRIERLERSTALGAGALGRMHRQLAVIIKGEQTALPEPQRFINQLPGSAGFLPRSGGPGRGRRVH